MSPSNPDPVAFFIAEARRLLSIYESARVDFYLFLHRGETTLPWQAAGFETFESFLDANDVKRVTSYRNFVAALNRFGEVELRTIGLDAALALLRAPADKAGEAQAHLDAWVKEYGKPVPAQTASRIMDRYAPPVSLPRVIAAREELHRLRAENSRLASELNQAQKKILELQKQLKKAAA